MVSGMSEDGIHDDPAPPTRQASLVGTVIDEHALGDADLVGGQTYSVGFVHRLVEIGDQLGEFGGQRTVRSDGYGTGHGVQDGISHNADRYDGHDWQA
jgi:hypothetical protein